MARLFNADDASAEGRNWLDRLAAWAAQRAGGLVLWLHRRAEQFDLIPAEFGQDGQVDGADPDAVAAEWVKRFKLWAAYNPEQMFALKAGALALGLLMAGLLIGVAAL